HINKECLTTIEKAIPTTLKTLLREANCLMIAGGFIRDTLFNDQVNDIDVFMQHEHSDCEFWSVRYSTLAGGDITQKGPNYTVRVKGQLPVHFISSYLCSRKEDVLNLFDFTINSACVYYSIYSGPDE